MRLFSIWISLKIKQHTYLFQRLIPTKAERLRRDKCDITHLELLANVLIEYKLLAFHPPEPARMQTNTNVTIYLGVVLRSHHKVQVTNGTLCPVVMNRFVSRLDIIDTCTFVKLVICSQTRFRPWKCSVFVLIWKVEHHSCKT